METNIATDMYQEVHRIYEINESSAQEHPDPILYAWMQQNHGIIGIISVLCKSSWE